MSESVPNSSRIEKLKIDRAFYFKFSDEDQKAMKVGVWPYKDPEWVLNKWKTELETSDDKNLSEEQRENKWNALWLWYHHASQFAYTEGNIETALTFINKALEYREKVGLFDNQITPLLKLLYLSDIEQAKLFFETIPSRVVGTKADGSTEEVDNEEKETAASLIEYFEKQNQKKS